MYSASVGIGGLVGSRPIWSYSFLSMLTRASRSRTIGINVRLRRLTIRGPNSTRYKSRQSSWYSVKHNALDDATAGQTAGHRNASAIRENVSGVAHRPWN